MFFSSYLIIKVSGLATRRILLFPRPNIFSHLTIFATQYTKFKIRSTSDVTNYVVVTIVWKTRAYIKKEDSCEAVYILPGLFNKNIIFKKKIIFYSDIPIETLKLFFIS